MKAQIGIQSIHPDSGKLTKDEPQVSTTVDRSQVFQRTRPVWPLVEKTIAIKRRSLREQGLNRRDAGEGAWAFADQEFDDEAIRNAAQITPLIGSTPPGLEPNQATAWQVALGIVAISQQRSARLNSASTELIMHAKLRIAMKRVDTHLFDPHEYRESLGRLAASRESCVNEIGQITKIIESIKHAELDDELEDELGALLDGLYIGREVAEAKWETTSFAVSLG